MQTKRTGSVLWSAMQRPKLQRIALVYACFKTAELGTWIAITTVAYIAGGITTATVVLVVQLAPATLVALRVDRLAETVGSERVLVGGLALQTLGLVGVAVSLSRGTSMVVAYGCAVLAAVAVVSTRPSLQTLLPGVVESPEELTAANAVIEWTTGVATLAGPALTALTFATVGRWAPFAVFAALTGAGLLVATTLHDRRDGTDGDNGDDLVEDAADRGGAEPPTTDLRPVRLTLLVMGAGGFLFGALDLLVVVVAIDLTGGTAARAALLSSAFGFGALVGGFATTALVTRRHVWPAMVGAALLAATATAGVGTVHRPGPAAILLAVVGAASAVMLMAARSLLQRISDFTTLCRVFSLAEATEMGTLLAGSLAIPVLVSAVGTRGAPAVVGALVAGAALLAAPTVARAEGAAALGLDRLALLRQTSVLTGLPLPALDLLARQCQRIEVPSGTTVIEEGEVGDCFYVVESGQVEARRDGALLRLVGPGEGFGEIALLLDTPRTASVVTTTPTTLLAVDRRSFLVAVTGHAPSRRRARSLAERRAGDDYSDPAA